MLTLFTGTHDHKMDDKGRVSLPTEFRRVLDSVGSSGALFIIPWFDSRDSHVVFDTDAYNALIQRHNKADYPDIKTRKRAELKLMKRVVQVQVDPNGRIVLNKDLREMIGLDREIKLVGIGDRFEIWNPDAHDRLEAALLDDDEVDGDLPLDLRGLR